MPAVSGDSASVSASTGPATTPPVFAVDGTDVPLDIAGATDSAVARNAAVIPPRDRSEDALDVITMLFPPKDAGGRRPRTHAE
jgi:hypothetical protein